MDEPTAHGSHTDAAAACILSNKDKLCLYLHVTLSALLEASEGAGLVKSEVLNRMWSRNRVGKDEEAQKSADVKDPGEAGGGFTDYGGLSDPVRQGHMTGKYSEETAQPARRKASIPAPQGEAECPGLGAEGAAEEIRAMRGKPGPKASAAQMTPARRGEPAAPDRERDGSEPPLHLLPAAAPAAASPGPASTGARGGARPGGGRMGTDRPQSDRGFSSAGHHRSGTPPR